MELPLSPGTKKRIRASASNFRANTIISQYVLSKVEETEVNEKIYFTRSLEDILIKELRKEPSSSLDNIHDNKTRNVDVIMYSLNQLKEFFRYRMFNNLANKDIMAAAVHFKHAHYRKGEYIFRFHGKSDRFFGIIKGTVGIRGIKCITNPEFIIYNKRFDPELEDIIYTEGIIKDRKLQSLLSDDYSYLDISLDTMPYRKSDENHLRYDFEFEKVVFSSGMCLGEWGIIDNVPRTASVFCKENTDAFYLEKEPFMKYLSMCFIKSTGNKKQFLNYAIPGLAKSFVNIVPLFFQKNQVVYNQFDLANFIYIIYQGECSYIHLDNIKSADDIVSRKTDWKVLYIVEEGSILGLESLQYGNESSIAMHNHNTNRFYQYNLIASQDFTAIYSININLLAELGYDCKEYLRKLYELHKRRLSIAELKLGQVKLRFRQYKHKKVFSDNDASRCAKVTLSKISEQIRKKNENKNMKRLRSFVVFPKTLKSPLNLNKSKKSTLNLKNRIISSPQLLTTLRTTKSKKALHQENNSLMTQVSVNTEHRIVKDRSASPLKSNYKSERLITLQNLVTPVQMRCRSKKVISLGFQNPKCLNIRHQLISDEKQTKENIKHYSRSQSKNNQNCTYYDSGFYDIPLITDIFNKSNKI